MLTRLLVTVLGLLALQCMGQTRKDLVYGKLAESEIVSAIRFSGLDVKGEFIKFDNMGNGDPFPTIISYDKIESIASIRIEDTIRVSQSTFNFLFKVLITDSTQLKRSMTSSCGTFRFILHSGNRTWVYFVNGYSASRNYFEASKNE